MSDDWDFYRLLLDSEPASIYLNLGLADDAPIERQLHVSLVRIVMRQPRPDGLSSDEEFDDLVGVEDSLTELLAVNDNTTYAGRNTSGGNRDFYFYTDDPAAFAESVTATMASHPHYQFEIRSRPDPKWDVYFNLLHPSPVDLQRIFNRRVTQLLKDHGDNLSVPRWIDHFAYLPDSTAAETLRAYLGEQDFSIDEPTIEGGSVGLSFKRPDRPDSIGDVVIPIVRRVQELGGKYDGWGCEVAN